LIIDLVENPGRLAQIRQQLIDNRLSAPLFDSATYTKHLEKAYVEAYDRYFEGKEPDHIFVS
jgi:predicted O-linked N-acetylglucosamine transferase (SPINDLY family)